MNYLSRKAAKVAKKRDYLILIVSFAFFAPWREIKHEFSITQSRKKETNYHYLFD
jgi:hypothetical protein